MSIFTKVKGWDVRYSTRWGTPTQHMTIKPSRFGEIDSVHWFLVNYIARVKGINRSDVILLEWKPIT